MTKLYSTLGRNFSKKDLEQVQQAAEFDTVSSVAFLFLYLIA